VDGMVLIPGGRFHQGSPPWVLDWLQKQRRQPFPRHWFTDEIPQIDVSVPQFWIDRHPVTVGDFREFVRDTGFITDAERSGYGLVYGDRYWHEHESACWFRPAGRGSGVDGYGDHPVVHISWNDANSYAEWAGKRLPSETEWELAARGFEFRVWPWGDTWHPDRANTAEYHAGPIDSLDAWREWWERVHTRDGPMPQTTPVGSFSDCGDGVFGCADMAGNVYEWTSTLSYLYDETSDCDATLRLVMGRYRVIRGGSWMNFRYQVRCGERMYGNPDGWSNFALGFRCAKDAGADTAATATPRESRW
jgi:sulfatase modifying factor 1